LKQLAESLGASAAEYDNHVIAPICCYVLKKNTTNDLKDVKLQFFEMIISHFVVT
jgi:hypothetical protein